MNDNIKEWIERAEQNVFNAYKITVKARKLLRENLEI